MLNQFRGSARDGFGMNITIEAVFMAQDRQTADHAFHGVIRILDHAGGKKEALDIIAAEKADGEFRQFPGREDGPGHIVAAAVDAVFTVADTIVGHQDFQ